MVEVRFKDIVFKDFPDFRRGLVLASGLDNHGGSGGLEGRLKDESS